MSKPESEKPFAEKITFGFLTTSLVLASIYFFVNLLLIFQFILIPTNIFGMIRYLYICNFVIIPCLGLVYSVYNLIFQKNRRPGITVLLFSILFLCVFCYATLIEPRSLKIEEYAIQTDKIEGQIVVAHISDFQSARVGSYEAGVIDKLIELDPDIILHTGDLVQPYDNDDRQNELEKLSRLFVKLKPKYGIYNVVGNIDGSMDLTDFDLISGSKTLISENIEISDKGIELDILGLTFEQSINGDRFAITNWINKSSKKFTILLGHAPDYVLDVRDKNIDLCLAGHTHGGQVRLPFIGAVLNASKTPKSWARGFREIDSLRLNVSAGIGSERHSKLPAIRFNCPPSISIIKINGQDN